MNELDFENQAGDWTEYLEDKIWSPHAKAYVDAPEQTPYDELSEPQQRAIRWLELLDMQDATEETAKLARKRDANL